MILKLEILVKFLEKYFSPTLVEESTKRSSPKNKTKTFIHSLSSLLKRDLVGVLFDFKDSSIVRRKLSF